MSFSHNRQKLPSLRSLQVFEVAARHQSFTLAGDELAITPGAVSRQIQDLEQWLGIKLFARSGPNLKVTTSGKILAERIGLSMESLREAVHATQPKHESRNINLSMMSSLATKWFAPRLAQFIESHPSIDLRIAATQELIKDFETKEIDAAIRYGAGNWANFNAEFLAEETLTPVCSPAYAEHLNLKQPTDLLRANLLPTATKENWTTWFQSAGIKQSAEPVNSYLGDGAAILEAVVSGQGIALGRSILIAEDLQKGRVITPFNLKLKSSFSYWFVTPSTKVVSGNLGTVRDWLKTSFHESS